jgi:hypothetical protein
MSGDHDEYAVRVKMYRLLVASPEQGAEFSRVSEALADPELRQPLSSLVGVAFGEYARLRDEGFSGRC